MSASGVADYLDHMLEAASLACSYTEGLYGHKTGHQAVSVRSSRRSIRSKR
jgi:hypothetical protein